jgi:hypothetical protein
LFSLVFITVSQNREKFSFLIGYRGIQKAYKVLLLRVIQVAGFFNKLSQALAKLFVIHRFRIRLYKNNVP